MFMRKVRGNTFFISPALSKLFDFEVGGVLQSTLWKFIMTCREISYIFQEKYQTQCDE